MAAGLLVPNPRYYPSKGVDVSIKVRRGVAGQVSVTADTPDGQLTFTGSEYGGPVVMITPTGAQTFVTDPGRFGNRLDVAWVERFLGASA